MASATAQLPVPPAVSRAKPVSMGRAARLIARGEPVVALTAAVAPAHVRRANTVIVVAFAFRTPASRSLPTAPPPGQLAALPLSAVAVPLTAAVRAETAFAPVAALALAVTLRTALAPVLKVLIAFLSARHPANPVISLTPMRVVPTFASTPHPLLPAVSEDKPKVRARGNRGHPLGRGSNSKKVAVPIFFYR